MDLIISNASPKPIYEQLYDQLRSSIISGLLKEGDLLPSIRNLAKDLRISVITTKRAYDELERDGLVNTVAGKGCFVSAMNMDLVREAELRSIEEHLRSVISTARGLGLGRDQILEILDVLENEEGDDERH
ncbi:MAG: GntR family transcriptional regulator [Sphaerochaetaceae bacterium]|jgi:GntR family transcriptional regulator|nr:GntR family transcriptional regulator [Sphaerochaetaceae bacterium]